MRAEPLEIVARDGYRLGATLFRPDAPNGRAVSIHAAAGVKQDYYAPFAAYLAEHGFAALTFDYRGVGRSVSGHVRDLSARMKDWAEIDAASALDFFQNHFPHLKLQAVGHSFGGQSFAVMPGNERFSALLAVGSQSCYWRYWPRGQRAGMWLLTRALLPAATRLCGYFPGTLLPQGEDLPAGVALEWARWTRHPRYLVGALDLAARASQVKAPLRLYWMSDDFFAPLAAAQALFELYPNARHDFRRVQPQEVGAERIGHFGFFRERFRDTLWRDACSWLLER